MWCDYCPFSLDFFIFTTKISVYRLRLNSNSKFQYQYQFSSCFCSGHGFNIISCILSPWRPLSHIPLYNPQTPSILIHREAGNLHFCRFQFSIDNSHYPHCLVRVIHSFFDVNTPGYKFTIPALPCLCQGPLPSRCDLYLSYLHTSLSLSRGASWSLDWVTHTALSPLTPYNHSAHERPRTQSNSLEFLDDGFYASIARSSIVAPSSIVNHHLHRQSSVNRSPPHPIHGHHIAEDH